GPLVGGAGGDHRGRRARAAAEHRTRRRMRDDERAVAGGPSRAQCRGSGRARHVGEERAADHRTRATHVLPPRPSDHMAAVAADSGTRLGGALEVADPPAHANGVAPADSDLGDFPSRGKTPFIPAHSASLRAFTPVFDGLWTRVNALMAGIQCRGLGPRFRGGERKRVLRYYQRTRAWERRALCAII